MQDEEDKDIEEIKARPEVGGKPTLVKVNKKEAI